MPINQCVITGDTFPFILGGTWRGRIQEIPSKQIWQILYGTFTVTTGAPIVTRRFTFLIRDDEGRDLFEFFNLELTENTSVKCQIGSDKPHRTTLEDAIQIPPLLQLTDKTRIIVEVAGAQFADSWKLHLIIMRWFLS